MTRPADNNDSPPLVSALRSCACGHPVYDDQEPRCPLCACQEHKPRFPAAGDHSAPAAASPDAGEAWTGPQPELSEAAPALPTETARRYPETCARTLPASVTPATRCQSARPWVVPGAHSPRAGATVPGAGNPPTPGNRPGCGHPRPGLPRHANIRRMLLPFPRGALASPGSAYRRKCPADLPLQAPTAAGAPRKHRAAVPRIPGRQPACLGAPAPATCPPCECRLPADLTERDAIGIGGSGRAPGVRTEGLDHWSSEPRARRPGGRRGPGAQGPRIGRRAGRFDKPRIAGSVRASKHGANMGDKPDT